MSLTAELRRAGTHNQARNSQSHKSDESVAVPASPPMTCSTARYQRTRQKGKQKLCQKSEQNLTLSLLRDLQLRVKRSNLRPFILWTNHRKIINSEQRHQAVRSK